MPNALRHKPGMKSLFTVLVAALLLLPAAFCAQQAHAQEEYASDPYDPRIARDAWVRIGKAEQLHGIPLGLLHAMALTETGQGIRGWVLPWPYTVGVNSTGRKDYLRAQHALNDLEWMRKIGYVRFDVRAGTASVSKVTYAKALALLAANPTEGLYRIEPYPFGRRFKNAAEAEGFVRRQFALGHRNMDMGLMQINWRVHGKNFKSVADAFNPAANVQYAVDYLLSHRQSRDWWGSVGRYHSATPRFAKKYILNVWNMYQRIHRLKA